MSTSARIDELRSKFDENPRRYFAPLANEYRKAGDLDQAIALCREHLPKQPGHMSGHIVFGQALFEHGELAEAQTVFESALELDPENLIALRHLGDIARSRGDALSAKRWYERVLDADPRNDDIASLLASLTQRMTPSVSQSPFGSPNAPTEYAPPVENATVEEDSFDSADSPQWHTPAFLTPLGSQLVSPTPSAPQEAPDLLDLDSMVDAPVAESEPNHAIAFDASLLADAHADFGGDESDSTSESTSEDTFVDTSDDLSEASTELASDTNAGFDSSDDVALEIPDFLATSFEAEVAGSAESTFDTTLDLDSMESVAEDADPLAVALDAFATNDPFEVNEDEREELATPSSVSFAAMDSQDALIEVHSFPENAPESSSSAPALDDADVFEEGLVAQEWPDTSVLSSRAFTPARARTPIDSAVVDEAFGREVVEYESEPEPEPEAPVVAALEPEPSTAVAAEHETESAIESETESEGVLETVSETVSESAAEPAEEPAPELAAVAELESEDAEDDVSVAERITTAEFEAVALVDEDPPVWSAEAPWSAVAEDEHEADDVEELTEVEELADVEPAVSESNPAFVTETMAELLVAQGFVDRAVTVYEELVSRRPYDEVLTSRLAELRATLVVEQAQAEPDHVEAAQPTPLYGVTPVESLPPLRSATPAWSSTPSMSATPVRSATPAYTATPVRSATPAFSATPINVPLVAPMSRPTARQFFAALAAVRVARRTPAYGAATVSSPTPADGLASLFGEMPVISDDMAARSLAQAFGNQDAMQPGPSLFSPASDEERERTPMSAAPAMEASSSASSFSFDRFFPDPASASSNTRDASEGAKSGGAVIGSDAGDPTTAAQPSAGEDLAQFASWLKGLSNS
jgi:hypothetical protein